MVNFESISNEWIENVRYYKPIWNNGQHKSCLIKDIIEIKGNLFLYESLIPNQVYQTKESNLKVRHFIDNKGKGCPLCGSKRANEGVCEKMTIHMSKINEFVKDGRKKFIDTKDFQEQTKQLRKMFP